MTTERDTPGLAGGPGPTPTGFEDGTPTPREPAPEEPGAAERQRDAGEVSERSAGTRGDEVREDRGRIREDLGDEPEEQQPDEG